MQYTPHYNLNLPEGTDIVNPLVQDNPNYTAIDTALYNNKLRVVGSATHVKAGTNHTITLGDSDINQFKFVATGDYVTGDTFTVDGVTVTPRIADGSTIPNGAFKINSTVLCILDGTILNFVGIYGTVSASDVILGNGHTVEEDLNKGDITVTADGIKTIRQILNDLYTLIDFTKLNAKSVLVRNTAYGPAIYHISSYNPGNDVRFCYTYYGGSPLGIEIARFNLLSGGNSESQRGNYNSVTTDISSVPSSGETFTIMY